MILCAGYLPKPILWTDGVYWSPVRQQYAVAWNATGDTNGLHVWSWHESKRNALLECKRKTEFRLRFTLECGDLYKNLDAIEKVLK